MKAPFILPEVWPMQRKRRQMTEAERDLRARVRKRKRQARAKALQTAEQAAQRQRNREIIQLNALADAPVKQAREPVSRQQMAANTRKQLRSMSEKAYKPL